MPNPVGMSQSEEAQDLYADQTLSAATADGNGTSIRVAGYNGALVLEVQKTGTGTSNVLPYGSNDGVNWYPVGYYKLADTSGGTATPTRSVTALALAAGAYNAVLQLLDPYVFIRAVLSGTSGQISVNAYTYAEPV